MEAALEAARAKDTKERLAGVERLHEALDAAARRGLTSAEATALVDTCVDLTRDANFRVAQGGLQALTAVAVLAGVHFKIHLNALVPAAVECLRDGKQPVCKVHVSELLVFRASPPPPAAAPRLHATKLLLFRIGALSSTKLLLFRIGALSTGEETSGAGDRAGGVRRGRRRHVRRPWPAAA